MEETLSGRLFLDHSNWPDRTATHCLLLFALLFAFDFNQLALSIDCRRRCWQGLQLWPGRYLLLCPGPQDRLTY